MKVVMSLDVVMAKRKMKSKDLAKLIGITEANLSVLRTGRSKIIRFNTLEPLCKYLDCQPGDILKIEENKKESSS